MNDTTNPPERNEFESASSRRVLRPEVRVQTGASGHLLVDSATGLRLEISADAARIMTSVPETLDDDQAIDAVEAFFDQLVAIGLCEPATIPEAARAQGQYVWSSACEAADGHLRAAIEHSARATRMHRERLLPILVDEPWSLRSLPLLRKRDLRSYFPGGLVSSELDLPSALRSGDVVLASTSGSTGERLQVYSDTRIARLPPDFLRFWRLGAVLDRPVRTVVFTSPDCSSSTCSNDKNIEDRILFEHTLFLPAPRNPFLITDDEATRALDEMHAFAADFWFVNPVYLALLATAAARLGRPFPPVSAILVSYQFFSRCQRRALARFGVPIFSLYAATELAGSQLAVSCTEGNLHLRLDHVFVELLLDGEPVVPGELGEVVVTTYNRTMPLVRYVLGDLARAHLAPCPCDVGSTWPAIVLEGRLRDAFVGPEGLISTKAVDDALADCDLAFYQLRETSSRRYTLAAVPEKGDQDWRHKAQAALSLLLMTDAVTIDESLDLPMATDQKFRFTVPIEQAERDPV